MAQQQPWWTFPTTYSHGAHQGGTYENGVDLGTPYGTPLQAIFGGKVTQSGYGPWGGDIKIDVGNGYTEEFLHLDQIFARVGDTVNVGQVLGISGGQNVGGAHPASPDYSAGPHTEFDIARNNTYLDPTGVVDWFRQQRPAGLMASDAPVLSPTLFTTTGQYTGDPNNPYLFPARRGGTPEDPGSAGITGSDPFGIGSAFAGLNKSINGFSTSISDAARMWQIGALGLVMLGIGLLILFWGQAKSGAGYAMDAAGAVNKQIFALNAARSARRGAEAQERTAKATEANTKVTRQAAQQQARANREMGRAGYRQGLLDAPKGYGRRGGQASAAARRERRESAAVPGSVEAIAKGEGPGLTPEQKEKFRSGLQKAKENLTGE